MFNLYVIYRFGVPQNVEMEPTVCGCIDLGVPQSVEMEPTVCGCIDLGWVSRRDVIFKKPTSEAPTTY